MEVGPSVMYSVCSQDLTLAMNFFIIEKPVWYSRLLFQSLNVCIFIMISTLLTSILYTTWWITKQKAYHDQECRLHCFVQLHIPVLLAMHTSAGQYLYYQLGMPHVLPLTSVLSFRALQHSWKAVWEKITHTQNNVINYVLHQNSVYMAVYNKHNLVLGRKGAGMIYLVYKCFDVPEEQFIFISILSMA